MFMMLLYIFGFKMITIFYKKMRRVHYCGGLFGKAKIGMFVKLKNYE